ncbi:hypothetical protein YTPLAS18_26120 [Nitrospira sp.]|nr:hypothetical protein YTPLAS18_26120 [Nitrospira sp.]
MWRPPPTLTTYPMQMRLTCQGYALLGLAGILTTLLFAQPSPASDEDLIPIRTPRGYTIHAELADTPFKRAQGLMYRESLPDDRGMLFIFGESQTWTFWMKGTKLPLDIIWLDEQKRIVHIEANLPTCSLPGNDCPQYQSNEPALYVLELRGGRAAALKLKRGTKLQF